MHLIHFHSPVILISENHKCPDAPTAAPPGSVILQMGWKPNEWLKATADLNSSKWNVFLKGQALTCLENLNRCDFLRITFVFYNYHMTKLIFCALIAMPDISLKWLPLLIIAFIPTYCPLRTSHSSNSSCRRVIQSVCVRDAVCAVGHIVKNWCMGCRCLFTENSCVANWWLPRPWNHSISLACFTCVSFLTFKKKWC